jgi:hypothetical protein
VEKTSELWNEDSKVIFKTSSDITNFWLEQTFFLSHSVQKTVKPVLRGHLWNKKKVVF